MISKSMCFSRCNTGHIIAKNVWLANWLVQTLERAPCIISQSHFQSLIGSQSAHWPGWQAGWLAARVLDCQPAHPCVHASGGRDVCSKEESSVQDGRRSH